MSCNWDFVQYVADQCAGAGEIMTKKMFGDYGIYCDGKLFGLICDDCLYLKRTDAVAALLRSIDLRQPYDGAKDYFYIFPMLTTATICRRLWQPPAAPFPSQN